MKRAQRKWSYLAAGVVLAAVALAAAHVVMAQPPPPSFYLCDLDGNGGVDNHDMALFLQAWRDYRTGGTWDSGADFNLDSEIDHLDAEIMADFLLNPAAATAIYTTSAPRPAASAASR